LGKNYEKKERGKRKQKVRGKRENGRKESYMYFLSQGINYLNHVSREIPMPVPTMRFRLYLFSYNCHTIRTGTAIDISHLVVNASYHIFVPYLFTVK
jgi:hypothetical protein